MGWFLRPFVAPFVALAAWPVYAVCLGLALTPLLAWRLPELAIGPAMDPPTGPDRVLMCAALATILASPLAAGGGAAAAGWVLAGGRRAIAPAALGLVVSAGVLLLASPLLQGALADVVDGYRAAFADNPDLPVTRWLATRLWEAGWEWVFILGMFLVLPLGVELLAYLMFGVVLDPELWWEILRLCAKASPALLVGNLGAGLWWVRQGRRPPGDLSGGYDHRAGPSAQSPRIDHRG